MTTAGSASRAEPGFDRFSIWGTSVVLGTTDPSRVKPARAILDEELAKIEQAASRFRPGTEILALNEAAGTGPVAISETMVDLIECAITADMATGGACDPTVADSLVTLGYDRDFDQLGDAGIDLTARPAPGTSGIVLDRAAGTVSLPTSVHLDLGATAKARAADLCASRIADAFGCGALVDIGGDLRTAGPPPPDGWQIGISLEARSGKLDSVDEVIAVTAGAIASSSTGVRTWRGGDAMLHHIIDPVTGWPTTTPWTMVTVAAGTCVEANGLSTASLVWGEDALFELPQRSVAARLVRADGTVERIGGWPVPEHEQLGA